MESDGVVQRPPEGLARGVERLFPVSLHVKWTQSWQDVVM